MSALLRRFVARKRQFAGGPNVRFVQFDAKTGRSAPGPNLAIRASALDGSEMLDFCSVLSDKTGLEMLRCGYI